MCIYLYYFGQTEEVEKEDICKIVRMTNAKLKIFHTDQRDIVETISIGQTAKHLPIQESFVSYGSFVSKNSIEYE